MDIRPAKTYRKVCYILSSPHLPQDFAGQEPGVTNGHIYTWDVVVREDPWVHRPWVHLAHYASHYELLLPTATAVEIMATEGSGDIMEEVSWLGIVYTSVLLTF